MKTLLLLFLSSFYLFASNAFIQPSDLKVKMDSSNLIILDTTDETTFEEGHIPGATRVKVSVFRHKEGTYQLMNDAPKIQKELRLLGINNDSQVVIYGHNKEIELLEASYVALVLVTNGLTDVSILNGGYPSWVSEYEFDELISTQVRTPKLGNFIAKRNENILVDMKYVKERIGKTPMIEARPFRFFEGSAKSSGVKRLGHIPKAKSSFWRAKFDSEYFLKGDAKLKDIYLKKNQLNASKEVIAYCTGGLEASMNWYILHSHLKFKDVKIYDASMREWGNVDDTPMEK